MQRESIPWPVHRPTLIKRVVIGAVIGLLLISVFLLKAGEPNPEWGHYWRLRPLLLVPFAGAVGGAFSYFTDGLRARGGWKAVAAIILSAIVFIFGLWMGIVLGLNGTYWN